jgi:hypothetical protein
VKDKLIPKFEELHPGKKGLFFFDNSTNHGAWAPDALIAQRMNLNPGGAQPVMRPGWFVKDGNRVEQSMVLPDGRAKGLKIVLEERDLWRSGLRKECKPVANHNADGQCCAVKILQNQQDFIDAAAGCALGDSIEELGHMYIALPKFHPEINPIESVWGMSKQYTRSNCDYEIKSLLSIIPESLDRIGVDAIRRFFRMAFRYMQLYRQGLSIELAVYANKKYRSHRIIPQGIRDVIERELAKKNRRRD